MRNLSDLLVYFLRRNTSLNHVYLSTARDHCLVCGETVSEHESYVHHRVCPTCRFHYSLTARERIELLVDRGTFRETNRSISSLDPLTFSGRAKGKGKTKDKSEDEGSENGRVPSDQRRTGLTEAVVTGHCTIGGSKTTVVVLDFGFMGGTMGSVVGEKVTLAFEAAAKGGRPLVAIVTGGGIRIQEGVLSLLQMAKTATAVRHLRGKGLPLIVVLANPATGQAYASFANLADIMLAEPGSLIGLAPMRTLREATKKSLPLDAHTAEAHLNHGLLDDVVDREDLKERISTILQVMGPQRASRDDNGKNGQEDALLVPDTEIADIDLSEAERAIRRIDRPTARDYIRSAVDHFVELKGDRVSGDDRTVVGGLGYLRGNKVVVLGQQRDIQLDHEIHHMYPKGFRKAQRLIRLASSFHLPVVSFVDTQGAHPGLESEEQGIGNAVATTMSLITEAPTPVVSVIVGEGGGEGALALGLADSMLMQQYAVLSPAPLHTSPGRWHRDPAKAREAAHTLMLTASECRELGLIDQVVAEPEGGAHEDPLTAAHYLQLAVANELEKLAKFSIKKLMDRRHKKFRRMGELTPYAKEALSREVEQLEHMVAREHSGRGARHSPRRTTEEERVAD